MIPLNTWTKGKYTLAMERKPHGLSFRIDNGWNSDYPIFYSHNGKIAYDNPEWWPRYIREWMEKIIRRFELAELNTKPLV